MFDELERCTTATLRSARVAFCLASLVLTSSLSALGQDTVSGDKSHNEYSETIAAGVQEFEAGSWTEAIMLFRKAHALRPSARTHRGLGVTYFEARKYVLAVKHLEACISSTVQPLRKAQRKKASKVLARARTMVGKLSIQVVPDNATVLVDGHLVPHTDEPITLRAGAHTLEFSARGYHSQRRAVDVVGEGEQQVVIDLESKADVSASQRTRSPKPTASPSPMKAPDEGFYIPLWPAVTVGAGGAMLAGAVVTALLKSSAVSELEDAGCQTGCDASYDDTRDRADALHTTTLVLVVAGAATVTGGALWWWLGPESNSSEVSASAMCGPTGCGAMLMGRF